jgi:hypothetical protein
MKAYISKINLKLLESFPNVWNTKLVWMLCIAFSIHVLFFILGFMSLIDPTTMHERSVDSLFFRNGGMLFSLIISILMLVLWLIHLFKNNAFKAFYPTRKSDLFIQFVSFFIIIFFSTTYFYSYSFGVKSFISVTYKDSAVAKDVKTTNNTALFFSHKLEDYLIDKARYPEFFYNNYCEIEYGLIDKSKPFYEVFEKQFQFYTIKSIDVKQVQTGNTYTNYRALDGYIHQEVIDKNTLKYYYKDSVVDASKHIATLLPSYKNYSKTFYLDRHNETYSKFDSYNHSGYNSYNNYSPIAKKQNQINVEFLNKATKNDVIKKLDTFITMVGKYKIPHNLTAQKWAEAVYNPTHFEVKSFLRKNPPPLYGDESINVELQASERFYKSHLSQLYIESDKLHNTLENINDIKYNNPLDYSIHIFLWIAFGLASLILMFRITGLRLLLFSIISVGVLAITIALIILLAQYTLSLNNRAFEFFSIYLIFTIATLILCIPTIFYNKLKKAIVGVALNISIGGFVLYVFLILGIISYHQRNYCDQFLSKTTDNCFNYTILDQLGFLWSFILLLFGFIYIYFYIRVIKRWKALPEA